MAMKSSIGKNYDEIWAEFLKEHSGPSNSPADLRRIHIKWKRLAAEA